jgi:hypothetical protein
LALKLLPAPFGLQPAETGLSLSEKFQFYVGPPRSGAPVHFHLSAFK